jgi:hypothetical protein
MEIKNLHRHLNHIKAESWYLIDLVHQLHVFSALQRHQIFQKITVSLIINSGFYRTALFGIDPYKSTLRPR